MDKTKIEDCIQMLDARFNSKTIEHKFRQHTLSEDKKRGLLFILIIQVATVLLAFWDFKVQGIVGSSSTVFARFILIIGSFITLFFSLKTQNEKHFDFLFFLICGLMVLVQSYTGYFKPFGNIPVAVTEVIIIMVIYMILPTSIVYKIMLAVATTIFSIAIVETSLLIIHHSIVHLFGLTFSFFINRSKRNQFLLLIKEAELKRELEKSEKEVLFISKKLAEQNKILKEHATRDQLTGIHNRRSFYEFAEEQWSKAVRKKEDCSVILIDIDHFKKINDTYGHLTGDIVLKGAANAIGKLIRPYDRFARWGGEEFVLYLPETEIEQAKTIAERFRKAVEKERFCTGAEKIPATISLGISSKAISGTHDLDVLLGHADRALYAAKTSGRNKVCQYSDSLK